MNLSSDLKRSIELFSAGEFERAGNLAARALQETPDEPMAHRILAGVHLRRGDPKAAVVAARRGLELDEQAPDAAANLASALVAAKEGTEAEQVARRAIELDPDHVSGWINLGLACRLLSRHHDAAEAFRQAVARQPRHFGGWTNLANALVDIGAYAEAVGSARRALEIQPGAPGALNNLGNALLKQGELDQAQRCYRQALSANPGDAETSYNLGIAQEQLGQLSSAEATFRGVLQADPAHSRAINNLGVVLKLQGRLDEAAVKFERVTDQEPRSVAAAANCLSTMLCQSAWSPAEILQAHQRTAARLWAASPVDGRRVATSAERPLGPRPLRVGFISPDFGHHPVGRFLLGAFESLDRDRVQAICFSDRIQVDSMTDRFHAAATEWHDIRGRSDEAVFETAVQSGLDLLVDLAGHTGRNRLGVLAQRAAPVQWTWIGYPCTTGLEAIDAVLADDVLVPLGQDDAFSESVVRLDGGHVSYLPPVDAPDVSVRNGEVVLGSFNKIDKTTPEVVATWSEILKQCDGGRLVMRSRGLDDPAVVDRFRRQFEESGIDASRVEFHGWIAHSELLAAYGEIDLALDTFPFSGGLTSCEALWMGVPVVTWAGDRMCGRQTASFLHRVDATELVASNLEEYVAVAVEWATDLQRCRSLRTELRDRMRTGPLCDPDRLAEEFTRACERACGVGNVI